MNKTNNINLNKGIYVADILKRGAADNTELKAGDIITKIDNIELNTMNDLRKYIYSKKPGDEVILDIPQKVKNKTFWGKNITLQKSKVKILTEYRGSICEIFPKTLTVYQRNFHLSDNLMYPELLLLLPCF